MMALVKRTAPYNYESEWIINDDERGIPTGVKIQFDYWELGPYIRDDLIQIYTEVIELLKSEQVSNPCDLIDWL